jgi:hypothetical protein
LQRVTVAELSVAAVRAAVSDASLSYRIISSAQLSSCYQSPHQISSCMQACHIASSAQLMLPISIFVSNKFGHKNQFGFNVLHVTIFVCFFIYHL